MHPGLWLTAVCGAILAACASTDPPAQATVAASSAVTPDAPPTASPPPAGAARGVDARGGARAANYHVIEKNGAKYYCRDQPPLGTRVKSRDSCLTAEQYEAARQGAQDAMRRKQGQWPHQE